MKMPDEKNNGSLVARRDLLKAGGSLTVVAAVALPGAAAVPVSQGYLVVDHGKCQGCLTCMLACSLVNHGRENLSLARIQVLQDSYGSYPDDVQLSPCRQCVDPQCLASCPRPGRALLVDPEHGNVRAVNPAECIGCHECIDACPFAPARAIWNHEDNHAEKCDLCAHAPYWSEPGGAHGKQACVEMCPVKALALVHTPPPQRGDDGYDVNLRGYAWHKLGFPTY